MRSFLGVKSSTLVETAKNVQTEPLLGAIERCRKGEPDALEPIYHEYKDLVFRICHRFAGDSARAADWAQDVFIHVFKKIGSYNGKSKFSTWLYRVAANYCLDQLKKRTKEEIPLEAMREAHYTADPAERIAQQEIRRAVWQGLASLQAKLRAVLVLKDLEGLSYREIAEILELPEGTVASRLNQARKELAARLAALNVK